MQISYRTQSIRGWIMRLFLIPSMLIVVLGGLLGATKASEAQKNQLSEVSLSLYLDEVSVMEVLDNFVEETEFTFAFNLFNLKLDIIILFDAISQRVVIISNNMILNINVIYELSCNIL